MKPTALLLAAANLLPLAGVLYWGWDAFVLLILYWLETAIIGFWTIVRVIAMNTQGHGGPQAVPLPARFAGALGLGLFFTVHAGIFMAVHFVFLWTLFSDGWAARIHGPVDFVRELIVGTDLWIPLLVLFLVRGAAILGPPVRRRLGIAPARDEPPATTQSVIMGLYVRIVVMQVAIIFGAWVAVLLGSVGPLILLVILKTGFDLFYDPIAAHVEGAARMEAADKEKRRS